MDHDRTWLSELRAALGCSGGLLALMLLVDLANGTLALWRALCWTAVAVLLLAILCPPRVTAGEHWLASRGLVRTRRVHTDLLVAVRGECGPAPRLVLRDALGGRVVLDPAVLTANPVLWHRLDQGVRRSRDRGVLRCGAAPLRTLTDRIDGDGARAVFEASGLRCGAASRPAHHPGPGPVREPGPGSAGAPGPGSVRDPGPGSVRDPGPGSVRDPGPGSVREPGPPPQRPGEAA
ncbi:hypothetical protein [Streptomyces lydicus]|uniref:hypothetical protein n=1 Tax=Streptomyces lydicus TaxID=47763 RepID=UPI0037AF604F